MRLAGLLAVLLLLAGCSAAPPAQTPASAPPSVSQPREYAMTIVRIDDGFYGIEEGSANCYHFDATMWIHGLGITLSWEPAPVGADSLRLTVLAWRPDGFDVLAVAEGVSPLELRVADLPAPAGWPSTDERADYVSVIVTEGDGPPVVRQPVTLTLEPTYEGVWLPDEPAEPGGCSGEPGAA